MKIVFFFTVFTLSLATYCQTNSTQYNIDKLGWNSFEEVPQYAPKLIIKADIKRLVQIKDTATIIKLFKNLKVQTKTVACHIALTKIFDSSYAAFACGDSKLNCGLDYTYNGLTWTRKCNQTNSGKGIISKNAINSIMSYWKRRLNDFGYRV
jgi:hypothetical protein